MDFTVRLSGDKRRDLGAVREKALAALAKDPS